MRYLLLLLAVCWIPEIVKMQVSLSASIQNDLPPFVERLPNININNGVVSFDKPSPYIINDDKTGRPIIIFDTSGKYTSLEGQEAQLLLTESKFIYRKDRFETREYDLSNVPEFSLTHERILSWASWGNYAFIFLYLLIIPCAFLYRAFQGLIYALIGLIIQAILQTKYSFCTIYRLTLLAITPALILDKVLGFFKVDFTGWSLICLVISLAYLYFGMLAGKYDEAASTEIPATETPVV